MEELHNGAWGLEGVARRDRRYAGWPESNPMRLRVYPALQLLADEGLVTSEETAGKRVFDLTDTGKAAVAEVAGQAAPWDEAAGGDSGAGGLREAAARLMPAIFQIGKAGSTDQVTAAIVVLNDARKKL